MPPSPRSITNFQDERRQLFFAHAGAEHIRVAVVDPKPRPAPRIPEFPARLRAALRSYDSVSAAAFAIHRSEGAVRKWLKGKSEPSAADLRAISERTGVSVEWLLFGEGNCYDTRRLTDFIAHTLYQRIQLRRTPKPWRSLSPAQQERLRQLACDHVSSWVRSEEP